MKSELNTVGMLPKSSTPIPLLNHSDSRKKSAVIVIPVVSISTHIIITTTTTTTTTTTITFKNNTGRSE